jgi:mono/diheme cytochrome c family protein
VEPDPGPYDVPVVTIPIPSDQASITRGEHIATTHGCATCHTEDLSGQTDIVPALFTITFPNLTSGEGGIGATNTDTDWVRAIRHGVGHDGRGLVLMPVRAFYYLSDEDLGALIAYLMSLPPVDNELPRTNLGPVGRVMLALGQLPAEAIVPDVTEIDHDAPRPAAPEPGVTTEYGQYLAHICTVCHGPELTGQVIRISGSEYVAPNLTSTGELGFWSEEDFISTLRTGVTPSGRQLVEIMPWKEFGQMTDDELRALWLYLQSLPALEQDQ